MSSACDCYVSGTINVILCVPDNSGDNLSVFITSCMVWHPARAFINEIVKFSGAPNSGALLISLVAGTSKGVVNLL